MLQRNALMAAAALTAFVLTVIGGVAAGTALSAPAPAAATAAPTASDPTADPAVQQIILQREAEYRRLIEQANAQLAQAYQQQNQTGQLNQASSSAPAAGSAPAAAAPAGYPVSPDIAAAIALNLAPGTALVATPELVDYRGVVAYEVRLNRGTVYVDATTGKVLYNGLAAPRVTTGEEHESDDHEGGEH